MATTKPPAAYAPVVPSPLNPEPRSNARITSKSRHRGQCRRPSSISPAEVLLRYKAARAWKSEALSRRVAQFESEAVAAVAAARDVSCHAPPTRWHVRWIKDADGGKREEEETKWCTGRLLWETFSQLGLGRAGEEEQWKVFRMPDLIKFNPKRVLVTMGLLHMWPSLQLMDGE